MLLFFATACHPQSAASPEDTGGFATVDVPEPELAPDAVDAAVSEVLPHLHLALDLYRWFGAIHADLAENGREPSCPESRGADDTWAAGFAGTCAGAEWWITGDWQVNVTREKDADELRLDGAQLYSIRGHTLDDDTEMFAGGDIILGWDAVAAGAWFTLSSGGSFHDPTDALLADPVSETLDLAGWYGRTEGLVGDVSGGLAIGTTAVRFDSLSFAAGDSGPTGTFSVRDPSSGWWTVTLADDGSGCGTLDWYGETRGESCAGPAIKTALEARLDAFLESPP